MLTGSSGKNISVRHTRSNSQGPRWLFRPLFVYRVFILHNHFAARVVLSLSDSRFTDSRCSKLNRGFDWPSCGALSPRAHDDDVTATRRASEFDTALQVKRGPLSAKLQEDMEGTEQRGGENNTSERFRAGGTWDTKGFSQNKPSAHTITSFILIYILGTLETTSK